MKKTLLSALLGLVAMASHAFDFGNYSNVIYHPQVKSLQAVVNSNWTSLPVMRLGSDDVLNISFDELSHDYHRYIYEISKYEADWERAEDVFLTDYLEGFDGYLTKQEIKLMPAAGAVITFELAVRFLSDYLDGDRYFKTTRPGHNLDRARTQIALARTLEKLAG